MVVFEQVQGGQGTFGCFQTQEASPLLDRLMGEFKSCVEGIVFEERRCDRLLAHFSVLVLSTGEFELDRFNAGHGFF